MTPTFQGGVDAECRGTGGPCDVRRNTAGPPGAGEESTCLMTAPPYAAVAELWASNSTSVRRRSC